jgi:2-phospho-L-lactate guanylyltransferase
MALANVQTAWAVIVPVKVLAAAKSRLDPHVGGLRRDLALAMAIDTIAAIAACDGVEVLVVTDDAHTAVAMSGIAEVIPDRPAAGINAALHHAAAALGPSPDRRLAAVQADLPALRSAELTAVLRAAIGSDQAFVADTNGAGTTVYAAASTSFAPRFGPESAAAHRKVATELALDVPTLRRDVDTIDDLWAAARLGVGPRTAELLPLLPPGSAKSRMLITSATQRNDGGRPGADVA